MIELILGGARSGKSTLAEQRAAQWQATSCDSNLLSTLKPRVIYVATAEAGDSEMAARIAHHRQRRPADWTLAEAPLQLADTMQKLAAPQCCLLVDCLTLWLSNLIFAGRAAQQAEAGEPIDCPLLRSELDSLAAVLPELPGRIILVSNEVGCGIVPMSATARLFTDQQGWLNQSLAALADRVTLVAAGLPLTLKGSSPNPAQSGASC